MGWWFGRKSAPEVRPFVPVWLQGESVEAGGFVRGVEGMAVIDRISGQSIVWRGGSWESGVSRVTEVRVNGTKVLAERQAPIADPSGGTVVDAECRLAVADILDRLRAHGLIG